jgi:hypothetical protein
MHVGGSSALILLDLLSRKTEDIDVVDELPVSVRAEHALLQQLVARYGLRLAHFQSHYLPQGWQQRLRSFGRFGRLDVHLVDPIDIFVGKLFSSRMKDRDDLRALSPQLDRSAIVDRLSSSANTLAADPTLKANAENNWYIVYGQQLPPTC